MKKKNQHTGVFTFLSPKENCTSVVNNHKSRHMSGREIISCFCKVLLYSTNLGTPKHSSFFKLKVMGVSKPSMEKIKRSKDQYLENPYIVVPE